jgi:hypothetical protein
MNEYVVKIKVMELVVSHCPLVNETIMYRTTTAINTFLTGIYGAVSL